MKKKEFCTIVGVLVILSLNCMAQESLDQEDFDVLTIPVMRSVQSPGVDYRSGTLAEMGLRLDSVESYKLGKIVEQDTDWMQIRLRAGEAVRLWSSAAIALPSDSVSLHCIASVSGENIQQSGLAFINADEADKMESLSVNLSYLMDIPKQKDDFSFEYQTKAKKVYLLMQFVGPLTGTTDVILERIRVSSGYREIHLALGNTLLSEIINFGDYKNSIQTNTPPTTAGGYVDSTTNDNHTQPYRGVLNQALVMNTKTDNDILQIQIPFNPLTIQPGERTPKRIYAEAYIKRKSGDKGIFSIALFRGDTASGAYTDIPVASIPLDGWLRVESSASFENVVGQPPLFILQIRQGKSEIVVDDVALRGWHDSIYYWDADVIRGN